MNIIAATLVLLLLGVIIFLLPASVAIGILMVSLIISCVLLVIVVLMQRSKSDGLAGGAAFGGSFTEQFFGAGTPAILVKVTSWLGGLFFAITLALAVLFAKEQRGRTGTVEKILAATPGTNVVTKATNGAPVTAVSTNSASSASTNGAAKAK